MCNLDKIIVCIFHPVYVEKENSGKNIHKILEAIKEFNLQTVVIYPNNDEGSNDIITEIERNRNEKNINIFSNLCLNNLLKIRYHVLHCCYSKK